MSGCQNVSATQCLGVKMFVCQIVKVSKCWGVKMSRLQNVRCRDVGEPQEGMGWRLDGDYQMIKMHKFSVVKLLEFNKIKKK